MGKIPVRILACIRQHTALIVENALGADFDLAYAVTLHEAEMLLQTRYFDLILCSMNFDDSRMFDMLKLAKDDPESRGIPFACIKASPSILPDKIFEVVKRTAILLGADSFIEFHKWRVESGEPVAIQKLNAVLTKLAESPKAK